MLEKYNKSCILLKSKEMKINTISILRTSLVHDLIDFNFPSILPNLANIKFFKQITFPNFSRQEKFNLNHKSHLIFIKTNF